MIIYVDELLTHLVVEIVLRILIKHLAICARSDFCDLLRSCIAKPDNSLRGGGTKAETRTTQHNGKLKTKIVTRQNIE